MAHSVDITTLSYPLLVNMSPGSQTYSFHSCFVLLFCHLGPIAAYSICILICAFIFSPLSSTLVKMSDI